MQHELTPTSRSRFGSNCSFDFAATNDLNGRQFGRQLPRSQLKLRGGAQIRRQFDSRARKIHADCGAFANRAVDLYSAARLASHPVNLAQPETRALAWLLRCEEGLECIAKDLLGHAGPGIAHCHDNVVTRGQILGTSKCRVGRFNGQRSASGIASRALMARLRITCSICAGSINAGQRFEDSCVTTLIPPPSVARNRSMMPRTT